MSVIKLETDQKLDDSIDRLKAEINEKDTAKLFRLGLATLRLIVDGKKEGLRTVQIDQEDNIKKEIIIGED